VPFDAIIQRSILKTLLKRLIFTCRPLS